MIPACGMTLLTAPSDSEVVHPHLPGPLRLPLQRVGRQGDDRGPGLPVDYPGPSTAWGNPPARAAYSR